MKSFKITYINQINAFVISDFKLNEINLDSLKEKANCLGKSTGSKVIIFDQNFIVK